MFLIVGGRQQLWSLDVADAFLGDGTTWMEVAAWWGVDGRRHFALEDRSVARPVGVRYGYGREERLGIRMKWIGVQPIPLSDLDDPPQVHHGDAVAYVLNYCQVVRNEQQRQIEFPLEFLQQVQDLRLNRHIECRDRFICHNEVRLQDERPSEAYPLTLPPRKLVGESPGMAGLETDKLKHFSDPLLAFILVGNTVDFQSFRDRSANLCPRIQRCIWILEDDLSAGAERLELLAFEVGDVLAIKCDRTGSRFQQSDQHSAEGGLSAPRLTNESNGLASVDREVHSGHSIDLTDLALQYPARNGKLLLEVSRDHQRLRHRHHPVRGANSGRCDQARSPGALAPSQDTR